MAINTPNKSSSIKISATKVIVMGAMGRMGQMILGSCLKSNVEVVGAVESPQSGKAGSATCIDGLMVTDDLSSVLSEGCVIIDFTKPEATMNTLALALENKCKMVIGTTGLNKEQKARLSDASKSISIVFAPNMSVGVNLLMKLAEITASILNEEYDIEIIEAHHNKKVDAPSGTALGLAESVAEGRKVELDDKACYGREGMVGARPKGEIGIHTVRGGDIVGDHTVLYAGPGERIELKHVAHSRETFSSGSVKAAQFLADKSMGLFHMQDVLGLKDI